ncbi:MAG: lytic transglycosylase domain-containing protein [Bacteroidetes bacterium]|nr:lytic transglycosylase domain-containing protein [Bacteroidota bacterium]
MNIKRLFFVVFFTIIALVSGKYLIYSSQYEKKSDENYRKAFQTNYKIFSAEVPSKLIFCNEEVPLKMFYVRESLERELLTNTFWQSNTMLMLKRAYRWFPVIEPILKKNDIPDDFKYLALIESGFLNVVSPANAAGFWQFIKPTGQKYGLEITEEVDERYHLEKATEAACKFIKTTYNIFDNWTLAAAAYNMGEFGIKRSLESQNVSSYYDLYLNDETSRYVYRILALKLIYSQPVKYGYYLRIKDLYPSIPYNIVSIDSSISNLVAFAKANHITYRILKDFNPWLRNKQLTNKTKKTYEIKIPKAGYENYDNLLGKDNDQLFNDTSSVNGI